MLKDRGTMPEDHRAIQEEMRNFLALSFEERSQIYEDKGRNTNVPTGLFIIYLCKEDDGCAAFVPLIENLEHAPSQEFLKTYMKKEPQARFAMPQATARCAMRHILTCVGNDACTSVLDQLVWKISNDDHLEAMHAGISNDISKGVTPQDILDAREDARRRNAEE